MYFVQKTNGSEYSCCSDGAPYQFLILCFGTSDFLPTSICICILSTDMALQLKPFRIGGSTVAIHTASKNLLQSHILAARPASWSFRRTVNLCGLNETILWTCTDECDTPVPCSSALNIFVGMLLIMVRYCLTFPVKEHDAFPVVFFINKEPFGRNLFTSQCNVGFRGIKNTSNPSCQVAATLFL